MWPTHDDPLAVRNGKSRSSHAIPAVANAIWHATGVRLHKMPFTPERVLATIQDYEARLQAAK